MCLFQLRAGIERILGRLRGRGHFLQPVGCGDAPGQADDYPHVEYDLHDPLPEISGPQNQHRHDQRIHADQHQCDNEPAAVLLRHDPAHGVRRHKHHRHAQRGQGIGAHRVVIKHIPEKRHVIRNGCGKQEVAVTAGEQHRQIQHREDHHHQQVIPGCIQQALLILGGLLVHRVVECCHKYLLSVEFDGYLTFGSAVRRLGHR